MKKIIFIISFFLFMHFVHCENCEAQQIWQQTSGPQGGVTTDMLAAYQLYIGTILGVYATIITGGKWTNSGDLEYYISSMLEAGSTLYAGSYGHGVLKSTNNGMNWNQTALGSGSVTKLATQDNTKIYSVMQGTNSIVVSTDGGQTWNPSNSGITSGNVTDLVWSDVSGKGMAGTQGAGVFLTTNAGVNWVAVNNQIQNLNALCLDYLIGVNTWYDFCFGHAGYVSTNDGSDWEEEPLVEIKGDSYNAADFQEVMDNNQSLVNCIAVGTHGYGIYVTTNNGVNWAAKNNGLSNRYINKIRFGSLNHIMYACTNGGVYKSTDYGSNWSEYNQGLILTNITSYLFSGNNMYAGTAESGIFRSTNEGNNWTILNNDLEDFDVQALASIGNYLFAGTYTKGVYVSTNGGQNWSLSDTGLTSRNVSSFAVIGTTLYAGINIGGGVFKSTDNGANWTAVNSGLTNRNVQALFVSGSNLFAGTFGGGVFLSTNNGASWSAVNSGLPAASPIVYCFAQSGNNIYAGTADGVYYTSNNGTNWTAINSGMSGYIINSILPYNNILLAATYGYGVMMSSNNGSSWSPATSGLSSAYVSKLAMDNSYIFVGCYAGGLWRTTISQIGIQRISSIVPKEFTLEQNYPNPFNPSTKIKFSVPDVGINKNKIVFLKIFDLLGREVETLVNGQLNPGTYEAEWNASKYASGIYFYRLSSGEFIDVKKMILVK